MEGALREAEEGGREWGRGGRGREGRREGGMEGGRNKCPLHVTE